jgi:uncharacterized protein YozE (UPF0346 family)
MQKFLQGATANHIAWVMVDGTDFATPESAMSAATVIRIYGKLNTATGINFVSSGTGSLTNDIVHVGASATGIYTIALAAADLSDASAAFYDMYIVHLSATGAARQTIIASGVRTDTSYLSNVLSYISNIVSDILSTMGSQFAVISNYLSNASNYLSNLSGTLSDTYSLLSDTRSTMDSQFAVVSNYLSNASNYLSNLSGFASDIYSGVTALSGAVSDVDSALTSQFTYLSNAISDAHSDLRSIVSTQGGATPSQIWGFGYSDLTEASSIGSLLRVRLSTVSDIQSYLVVMSGVQSDIYSLLSDTRSTMDSQFAVISNYLSNASNYLSNLSGFASDIYSLLSDTRSTMDSQFAVTSNYLSNLSGFASDIYSLLSDVGSDLIVMSGVVSDIYSLLSDFDSDFESRVPGTFTELTSTPGATPTLRQALMLPYQWLRNNTDGTPTRRRVYNDAGAVVTSGLVSWDGGTSVFQQGRLG